jgi:hypothetical protein
MCASSHEMTPSQYVDFTVLTTRGNTGIALPDVANSVFPLQAAGRHLCDALPNSTAGPCCLISFLPASSPVAQCHSMSGLPTCNVFEQWVMGLLLLFEAV